MGVYNSTVITAAGRNLFASALAGDGVVAFTSVKTSSHVYPAGTDLTALTSLQDIVQSVEPSSADVYNNNVVQVSARLSNTGVNSAYLMQTIGLYAKLASGSETLVGVLTASTPDEMPVYDVESPSAFIFNIQMMISNAESITFNVNDTGTATVADIIRLQNQINNRIVSNGGDLSNAIFQTSVANSARLPIPAAGDSAKVVLGKIIKFFRDISSAFVGATAQNGGVSGIVPAPEAGDNVSVLRGDGAWAMIQNNITTDTPGTPLDAQMGYRMCLVLDATLPASGWTNSAPYTNTIGIFGMTAAYAPVIACGTPDDPSSANYKSIHKAYAMIDRAVTGSNQITFYCYSKKPTVDIPISIKGV